MGSPDNRQESQHRWIVHLVTRALRAAGATEIEYDADELIMRVRATDGSSMTGHLTGLFDDCVGASADDRAAHIDRFVSVMTATPDMPAEWDQVASRLRPVLRPAQYAQDMDEIAPRLVREFQPLLNEMVVIDQPHTMAYVSVEQPRQWGVTESVVFDQARANLAAPIPSVEHEPSDGPTMLQFVESGDEYWASNLLIDGWLGAMADHVGGRPVAFLPDTTGLTIAADEPTTIKQLLETYEEQYLNASRPLSPQAYTVDDAGRVVPYAVPVGDELWNAVRRSEVLFATQEYATQQEKEHDESVDGYIAKLMVKDQPDGGVRSITVWGEGVDYLLPQADYVAFVSEDRLVRFLVPWEVVARETGLVPEPAGLRSGTEHGRGPTHPSSSGCVRRPFRYDVTTCSSLICIEVVDSRKK